MKSELTEREVEKRDEFPKLMKTPNSKTVVLFLNSYTGMVVYKEKNSSYCRNRQIGYYSFNWHIDEFIDYEGILTLQN